MSTIHVDVVSAEESIFSGEAKFVALPGEAGELGIYPRHTPLITRIRPGSVRITTADDQEEFVFVAGGILEVNPTVSPSCPTRRCVAKTWTKKKPTKRVRWPKRPCVTPRATSTWHVPSPSWPSWRLRSPLYASTAPKNKPSFAWGLVLAPSATRPPRGATQNRIGPAPAPVFSWVTLGCCLSLSICNNLSHVQSQTTSGHHRR